MRKLALPMVLMGIALPLYSAGQITVKELEEEVARTHRLSDERAAKQLSRLVLTQRLSTAALAQLKSELPGDEARLALLALADAASFLDLPASDIPATAALDRSAQDALLASTVDYVQKTIPRLPDFFAAQQTIQFSDGPVRTSRSNDSKPYDRRLHLVNVSSATVHFLAGKEELDTGPTGGRTLPAAPKQLAVEGVFGPLFSVILKDVLVSNPAWGHWESVPGGSMAVFLYSVPEEKSHYSVENVVNSGILSSAAAYHGEIGVDPKTGAILRLTLVAVSRQESPVARADIMVEYGPVDIGGKTYLCPLRSVALTEARSLDLLHDVYRFPQTGAPQFQLKLNDVEYAQYHLFHTEMHLLNGDGTEPGADSKSPGAKEPPPAPGASPQR